MKSKQDLLAEARRINNEIRQMFVDVEHWNNAAKKPDEPPIDPDPGGHLKIALRATNQILGIEGE